MSFWVKFSFCLLAAAALITVNGCLPSDSSQLDEEKEPHFVLGKSRVNAMDYDGAVEAFGESLEVNPHSAAAHFQLACLFDTKKSDPAAAVYHYQEFLWLNPKADNAEVIRQRIYSCKQQLAADVLPLPSAPAAQRQLEDLAEKNRQLQDEVEKWRAYYTAQQAAPKTNPPVAQNNFSAPTSGSPTPDDMTTPSAAPATTPATTVARTVKARTHAVVAGETLAAIARKSSVSLTALEAANPGVTPKKMRVGQVLNLPAQ
ncbi:MAG TPA: LysM peptidoglycan-binding domain-containing protein [Verrucomicrobiae bacterium]|jgi:LysM repeat protein